MVYKNKVLLCFCKFETHKDLFGRNYTENVQRYYEYLQYAGISNTILQTVTLFKYALQVFAMQQSRRYCISSCKTETLYTQRDQGNA